MYVLCIRNANRCLSGMMIMQILCTFLYLGCVNAVDFGFVSFSFFLFLPPPHPQMWQSIKIHVNFVNNRMTIGQLFPSLQNALLAFGT